MEPVTNLLKALINISKSSDLDLTDKKYDSEEKTRIQAVGAGLEVFIRDSFCGVPGTITNRKEKYYGVFSWLGSKNNPPDAMLVSSDAIEIKKHEGTRSSYIALNSSPPRSKLMHDDSKILAACRDKEDTPWTKDYLYAIGGINNKNLKEIIFCYGDCFVAKDEIYQKPVDAISTSLEKLKDEGMELRETNELGGVTKIDPLDHTGLRVRGMWGLKSPSKIFENVIGANGSEALLVVAIMRKEKFESFPNKDRDSLSQNSFQVKEFKAKDPNDPQKEIDLVLIKYSK